MPSRNEMKRNEKETIQLRPTFAASLYRHYVWNYSGFRNKEEEGKRWVSCHKQASGPYLWMAAILVWQKSLGVSESLWQIVLILAVFFIIVTTRITHILHHHWTLLSLSFWTPPQWSMLPFVRILLSYCVSTNTRTGLGLLSRELTEVLLNRVVVFFELLTDPSINSIECKPRYQESS